jgi:hypothetical protein
MFGTETWAPLYLMFWRRHMIYLLLFFVPYGIYAACKKFQKKFKPCVLASIIYVILIVIFVIRFKYSMNIACYRLQTDTFDNYYDGYTSVDDEFIPDFLPSSFERGYSKNNIDAVDCKLKSDQYTYCWNYYFNEFEHWAVYSSQTECSKTNTAERASYFKDQIDDPKTKVLSYENADPGPSRVESREAYERLKEYYNDELVTSVDPSEIENSEKELFFDFRDKTGVGKSIIKPKDFTLHYPAIASRLKDESAEHPSVIRIFLDTTSKYRFYRKFPKSVKFLTSLKHNPSSSHRVVENIKQHNGAGFTNPNQIAFTTGVSD